MIKDYKGEMPRNVTTPEKAKAQKPFYKNWKFWLLTGLMTLFGACSIYGLVLGSQYVKAIERASHIIADAQSAESKSLGLEKHRNLLGSAGDIACVDMGSITWAKTTQHRFFSPYLNGKAVYAVNDNLTGDIVCSTFNTRSAGQVYANSFEYSIALNNAGALYVFVTADFYDIGTLDDFYDLVRGDYLYYKMSGSGQTAEEFFTSEGYQDGYEDGYSDGSDAINVPQSLKVLLPVGNQYSLQYQAYVDGVLDQEGQINSSQSAGAWALFTRARNQKLRVDLTLPVDSKAFWDFRSGWTSGTEVAGDYTALRQSWAVDGVIYLPTWIGEPQLYVGVVGTNVPDLTYRTISISFDVDHWGDIKVGAYAEGYSDGYQDGESNPTAYQSGYDAGYEQGHDAGEIAGYNRGIADGTNGSKALSQMFVTAFQQPFNQLYRFLNFNLLGINFLGLFTAMLTVGIGIYIIKKVL